MTDSKFCYLLPKNMNVQKFFSLKGDPTRKILRTREKGKKGRSYQVESWAYRLIEEIGSSISEAVMPKGIYFIWNGVRNRYEWINPDGYIAGYSREQLDEDKRFKKVRMPKRFKVEWSLPMPKEFPNVQQIKAISRHQAKALGQKRKGEYAQDRALPVV